MIALLGAFFGVSLFMSGSTSAWADSAPAAGKAVSIELSQRKIIRGTDGKERVASAASVLPGDVVEYRAIYRNVSRGTVTGLTASLPIPSGLVYLPRTASPIGAKFATSATAPSSAFAVEPLMRRAADGKVQAVPYNEYRTLHWTVARLAPGATFVVSARARVEAVIPRRPVAASRTPQGPPVNTSARP